MFSLKELNSELDKVQVDKPKENLYGRAFITMTEFKTSTQKKRVERKRYPIDKVPRLFYAQKPLELLDIDFKQNIPTIGHSLAIKLFHKILTLRPNCERDVSSWKEVVLQGLNLPFSIRVLFKTPTDLDIKRYNIKSNDQIVTIPISDIVSIKRLS